MIPIPKTLPRLVGRICAVALILIGGIVLLGWALDIGVLKGIFPGWVGMKANTAAAMMLGGATLALLLRDNTERKLEVANAHLAAIVNSSDDAIIGKDVKGIVTSWNLGARGIFGYAADEVVGRPIAFLIPPDRQHEELEILGRIGRGDNVSHFETVRLHKDGHAIDVSVTVSAIKNRAGNVVGASKVARDITDRKRAEGTDRRMLAVEEANRMKSEFLANMSHELRTPLNGIIGFGQVLLAGRPGPITAKQHEFLTDILNSGRHLLHLVNDVLDLAKVEAGKMELNPETFFVDQAIQEVCAVSRGMAGRKKIEIRAEVEAGLSQVTLDQKKFKQVLYNFVSNAVKFNNEGGRVEITAGAVGLDRFQVRVKDFGIGIDPGDIPRLFREFEQLDSGLTRSREGTGLGLALAKKIVEFQSGSIAVESEVGSGSTFSFELPRATIDRP